MYQLNRYIQLLSYLGINDRVFVCSLFCCDYTLLELDTLIIMHSDCYCVHVTPLNWRS